MSGKSLFGPDVPQVVIKSIFSKYDKDGIGRLEKTEVLAMMGDLGLDEKQAELCFMMLDKDGNNNVTEKELMDWLRSGEGYKVVDDPNRYSFLRRVADAFKKYDKDGSGVIDKDEFRALLASCGKDWRSCDDSVIEKALDVVDKDGSGTVSFTEFLDWMDKVNSKGKK